MNSFISFAWLLSCFRSFKMSSPVSHIPLSLSIFSPLNRCVDHLRQWRVFSHSTESTCASVWPGSMKFTHGCICQGSFQTSNAWAESSRRYFPGRKDGEEVQVEPWGNKEHGGTCRWLVSLSWAWLRECGIGTWSLRFFRQLGSFGRF